MVRTNIADASGVRVQEISKSFPVPTHEHKPARTRRHIVFHRSQRAGFVSRAERLWKVDIASTHRRLGCFGFR